MTISDLPPCPNCGDRNLTEVADYVSPDEPDRELSKYWWCLSCNWKSEIYYYPALQPELGLWEPSEPPFNQKVKAALQRLEAAKIIG